MPWARSIAGLGSEFGQGVIVKVAEGLARVGDLHEGHGERSGLTAG